MDVQKLFFPSYAADSYFLHNTPPHVLAYPAEEGYVWTELPLSLPPLSLPLPLPDDVLQMQQLRFPTPPITPPKIAAFPHEHLQKRTQSVIMKVGQGHAEHIPATKSILNDTQIISYDAASSESSSSPSSDYVCDWINCKKYFESLESLAMHVTQIHAVSSEDGLYYCCWAGCMRSSRGFNARYKMLVHVRTHTKEKPHHCHLCAKSFSRAENLKIHIRSHSGEKPYICTYQGCHKAYSNSSDRFKHTRTHSMEKPYVCKVQGCQKRYTDPSSLRKHVKTFKHAVQLINDSTKECYSKTLFDTQSGPTTSYLSYLKKEKHMSAMQNAKYPPLDVCHINASQLGRLYLTDTANYWSSCESSNAKPPIVYQSNSNSFADDMAMEVDVDVETPLDLRLKRY